MTEIRLEREEGYISFWRVFVQDELYARIKKSAFSETSFRKASQESRCALGKEDVGDVLFLLARSYALRLLAKKSYHSHILKEKLLSVGFSSQIVKQTLSFIQEKGYLNDEAYCQRQIEKMKQSGRSPKEIGFRMKKISPQGVFCNEDELFQMCLRKKYPRWASMVKDPRLKAKLIRSLLRRGFSLDCVLSHMGDTV